MLKSRTMISALVAAALVTFLYSAQSDPHQSVASDTSPLPPLETTPTRIEPFEGKSARYQPPIDLSEDELALLVPPGTVERAARRQQVVGDDDRIRIASPHPYPYRAVVHVKTASQGCSGWLIGSDTVITAGHCVHDGSQFTPITGITVASSIEGDDGPPPTLTTPFPVCGAKRLYSTVGWTSMGDEAYDYGAIKLDCKLGDVVGWLGAGDQPSPAGKPGRIIAYDPNISSSTCKVASTWRGLCTAVGKPMTIIGAQLFYDSDVEPGGSGGPVLIPTASSFAVAIHSWTAGHMRVPPHDKLNHGVLITKRVHQNLLAWRKATTP